MSQVELTTLGKSCEFFNGKAHEKSIDENGKYIVVNSKFISSEGKSFKRTNEQMFPLYKGDIVMVMSDVPNGKALAKCFIIDKDNTYSLNQRICCIRSKQFDTKYLYYQLNRHEHLLAFNNGENQTNLRKDDILACPLIKPSMEEQKRMVEELDGVFSQLEVANQNLDKNYVNAQEIYTNYLRLIFLERGDNWEEKRLNEICDFKSGTTIPVNLERTSGDVLYAKVGDMTLEENSVEMLTSSRFVNSSEIKSSQIIPVGSIIFPKRGGAIATNKKRKIVKPTIVDLNTMAITPHKTVNKEFLFHWFQLIDLNEISNGTSIPQINNYSFDDIYLQYPKSIAQQLEIVERLDFLKQKSDELSKHYSQKIEKLGELKSGILKRAFENELIEAE